MCTVSLIKYFYQKSPDQVKNSTHLCCFHQNPVTFFDKHAQVLIDFFDNLIYYESQHTSVNIFVTKSGGRKIVTFFKLEKWEGDSFWIWRKRLVNNLY